MLPHNSHFITPIIVETGNRFSLLNVVFFEMFLLTRLHCMYIFAYGIAFDKEE